MESAKLAACAAAALDPDAHRLLLRGREPAAGETFAHLGVRENQKLLLLETEASNADAPPPPPNRPKPRGSRASATSPPRDPPPRRRRRARTAPAALRRVGVPRDDRGGARRRRRRARLARSPAAAANSGVAGAFNAARENPRDRAAVPDDLAFAAVADALERALLRLDGAETGGEEALRIRRRAR